jgi:nucleoside-diphosphate-sugar epimerase
LATHVLVTGGAGYLGSILCEHLLAAGYRVTALDSLLYGPASLWHLCAHPRFEFVRADARDERVLAERLRGADAVIPLAAIVGAAACDRDPWLAEAVNVEAILLLDRLRSPRQLVVYPNTNSGYGTKSGEVLCTEATPLEPVSHYGRTKVRAEAALLERENTLALRLATVFGASPRMRLDLLLNHFVHAAVTEGYLVIFEKDFRRNFVHVRDVADCFVHCLEHAPQMVGRAYNVGLDGHNPSKADLAEAVRRRVPGFFVHYAEIGSDPDKRNYVVSNARLREAGFVATRSIDDGIDELLRAYRLLGRAPLKNV